MDYTATMAQFGNNTGIPVPSEVLEALGGGRRPAVKVTVNGFSFRGTVGTMDGRSLISFSAARRAESGIAGGDELAVELTLDDEPRAVEPPADLTDALRETPGALEAFASLSPSRQKAHVVAVESAKTDETRRRRIARVVADLLG